MTAKGIFSALGRALIYFAIYFGWQIIIMNWLSLFATWFVTFEMNPGEAILADPTAYQTFMYEVTERVYDLLMKYALHVTLVAGVLTVVTYVAIFRIRGKRLTREVGLNRQPILRLILLVIFGAALNIGVSMLLELVPFPQAWMDSYLESTSIIVEAGFVVTLLTTLFCAPIVEELTFRGLVYTRLKSGMPMLAAMLVSSWIFGVVHGNVIQFIYASLLGFLICFVRVKYESLTCCIALHLGFNSVSLFTEKLNQLGEGVVGAIVIVSAVISALGIGYIALKAPGKIELTMPKIEENSQQ